MDQAAKGNSALSSGDFSSAVSHYTAAISSNPQAVDYYIKRSTAYTRISPPDHASAFRDSELAVVLATKRAKRELIAQAQLRRGIALFGLERWVDAKQCFQWVKKLNEKEKSLAIWEMKVEGKLKGLDEGDEPAKPAVKELPEVDLPRAGVSKKAELGGQKEDSKGIDATSPKESVPSPVPAAKPEGVQTPASKIRHEWYQSTDTVTTTLFAKGVPKDKATVDIKTNSVEMSFPLPTGSDFNFSLDPLFSAIDPSASTYKVMSTKVEFTLTKATPGRKWSSLEGSEPAPAKGNESDGNAPHDAVKRAVLADQSTHSGPAYPTSSKSGPKNWDKVANDLTTKPKKEKKEGEDSNDDDGGMLDDDEGDPVNGFFKKLYKDADPDTRRAMMKSYQESNGTALSTNWSEVGKGKVETSPPDGMEAKTW